MEVLTKESVQELHRCHHLQRLDEARELSQYIYFFSSVRRVTVETEIFLFVEEMDTGGGYNI